MWCDGGLAMKIGWAALQLNSELIEIGKGFMAYALEKYAPRTAVMFADTLRFLSSTNLATGRPWDTHQLVTALEEIKKTRTVLIGFRRLYRWAMDRGINGVDPITYLKIKDVKSDRVDPYARIFLSQSGLDLDEEIRLLKRIEREVSSNSWEEAQFNIVLHLGFELAPRSIQFHCQGPSGLNAQPRRYAGEQDAFARQIHAGQNLIGGDCDPNEGDKIDSSKKMLNGRHARGGRHCEGVQALSLQ